MPKFKLICEHDDKNKLQHEFEEDFLSDAVINITSFLKGCGYEFGSLRVLSIDELFSLNDSKDTDCLYVDDFLSETYPEDDYIFEEGFPFTEDSDAMTWTVNEITKQPEPKEKCPTCKIDKDIMKNHNCYDSSCPKGKVEGW